MLDDGLNHLSLMCKRYIRRRGNFKLCSNIVDHIGRAARLGKIIFFQEMQPHNRSGVVLGHHLPARKHPFLHCVFPITIHCKDCNGEAEPYLLSAHNERSK